MDQPNFQKYLPEHLTSEQKEEAWDIVSKKVEEDLYSSKYYDFAKTNNPNPKDNKAHNRYLRYRRHTKPIVYEQQGKKTLHIYDFDDTIANNIRYGKLEASNEEIKKVADLAGITEFSETLEHKLETTIGESGIKLSGGQRQRVAIARAIIKNAPILILDEATSSLDNITEKSIYKTIKSLMMNKTVLIIAHRLSTIEDSDIIYVVDNGIIDNFGSHEELLRKSDIYKRLQLKEKLENEF